MKYFKRRKPQKGMSNTPFSITMHPGTEMWTLNPETLNRMAEYFAPLKGKGAEVHVYPRNQAHRVTGIQLPPYAFRGVTRGNQTICLVDATESHMSLAWLIAHELCHQMVDISPTLREAFAEARANDPGIDPSDDHFHEIDPEERFCDGIATRLIRSRLDRKWWRNQTPESARGRTRYGHRSHRHDEQGTHIC